MKFVQWIMVQLEPYYILIQVSLLQMLIKNFSFEFALSGIVPIIV